MLLLRVLLAVLLAIFPTAPVFAADGKMDGFGPLRLGISRDEVRTLFGLSKDNNAGLLEQRIELGGMKFDLLVGYRDDRVSNFGLTDRSVYKNRDAAVSDKNELWVGTISMWSRFARDELLLLKL